MSIENAKITNVSITMEDHGCLTFYITLEGGGWGVNFGGYCIGKGYLGADTFSAESGKGLEAMMRIMDVVGVSRWEDLEGKYARVRLEEWGDPVKVIGNIIYDKWFDIGKFFQKRKGDETNE